MTVETAKRKARDAADKLVRLQRELKAAGARREDAQRDVDEASRGRRFGEPVTDAQIAASWRCMKDAQSVISRLEVDIAAQKAEVKAANVAVSVALHENATKSRAEATEAQGIGRAARKAEKRASARRAHEERVMHLLVAARAWSRGENLEAWDPRLRAAVAALDYCDETIEGDAVPMPWDAA